MPIVSSESGRTSAVTGALANALSPIVFSFAAVGLLPKVTEASASQPSNAYLSIVSSASGRTTDVTSAPWKLNFPIDFREDDAAPVPKVSVAIGSP